MDDCFYLLEVTGRDLNCPCIQPPTNQTPCLPLCARYYAIIKLKNEEEIELPGDVIFNEFYTSCGGGSISFAFPIPSNIWKEVEYIKVINNPPPTLDITPSECGITYTWKLYSLCPCTGKQALYPKVDIEQFSVTGGSTIIRDGKILTNFNVIPGVQQTFIQVENRGFFTQNNVKVKVMGLPQGVSVSIAPDTQKIKAHNLGTYQATFEVGPNVPSGTYKITMMAYSDNGVFDTIQIDLIVP